MKNISIVFIFSFILILGGIGIILGGIHLNNKVTYFKENGILISAKVINVTSIFSKDSHDTYNADIIYTVDEKEYITDYSTSTHIKEGDIVSIYYDKNNPSINHHTTSNIGPIIMNILGAIMLITGITILFFILHKNIKTK